MKVALFGAAGNMGRRYTAILKSLGHEILPIEVGTNTGEAQRYIEQADRAIIATPTGNHFAALGEIASVRHRLSVLCEKPLVKEETQLNVIETDLADRIKIYTVNQYAYLPYCREEGKESWYNYFNHGQDGLLWDCFQIIGLANGPITLGEDSPTWQCGINGMPLNLAWMDVAYVRMVEDFMGPGLSLWDLAKATQITRKIWAMQ